MLGPVVATHDATGNDENRAVRRLPLSASVAELPPGESTVIVIGPRFEDGNGVRPVR
jgi:peptidyl-tRNA hydrolase